MLKISAEQTIKKYSEMFNVQVNDVIEWMHGYVNTPENYLHGSVPTEIGNSENKSDLIAA